MDNSYLRNMAGTTTEWWIDSAVPEAIDAAILAGAVGATTNPVLVKRSLFNNPHVWEALHAGKLPVSGDERAEELIRRVTTSIASKFIPVWKASNRGQGYVCAQVNPCRPGDADGMLCMAKRFATWAGNIAVKLPATAAGLDVLEECAALGITTVGTVSFTVAQAIEIARRQHIGAQRALRAGLQPGVAFSVIMVGRLDDYLRDVSQDSRSNICESDIVQAGIAVFKHAYTLVQKAGYGSRLMPAAMRGIYHVTAFTGGNITLSMSTGIQNTLAGENSFTENIDEPVKPVTLDRLLTLSEFRKAYEPYGMKPNEFIAFGATQRTLSQFVETGWLPLCEFDR